MIKRLTLFLALIIFNFHHAASQDAQRIHGRHLNWFNTYADSAALVEDANTLVSSFMTRLKSVAPVMSSEPQAVLNTKPFLIFYSSKFNRVNLPLWRQVIPEQKQFFYKLAGSEAEGEKMFGLFFNGFYLPHELGHSVQHATKKLGPDLYQNEYAANEMAILYWRAVGRTTELDQCYQYAKKVVEQLKNPAPEGVDPIQYGYYQFAQFVKIYEDKALPTFEEYMKKYVAASSAK